MDDYEQLMSHIKSMQGTFEKCTADEQRLIIMLSASFVVRDAVRHPDGSRGSVRTTPKKLQDLMAYLLKLDVVSSTNN